MLIMKKEITEQQKELLVRHIEEMADVEQDLRLQSKPGRAVENYLIYIVDMLHHQRIRWIIDTFGYPTKEMIGTDTLKKFFLLIQHVPYDTALQEQCLEHCDFEPNETAHLTDRIRINQGREQMFGTQRQRGPDGTFELAPVEDRENLNERRIRIGLDPL